MPVCTKCGRVQATAELRRTPKHGPVCKDKQACQTVDRAAKTARIMGRLAQ